MSQAGGYALIFEGHDGSQETLRRIRSALVGELQMSAEQAKEALEQVPTTLGVAESEQDFAQAISVLQAAGARVLLVRQKPVATNSADEFSFEMSLDGEEEAEAIDPALLVGIEQPGVYTLDDPDESASTAALSEPEDAGDSSDEVEDLLQQLESSTYVAPVREKAELPPLPESILRAKPSASEEVGPSLPSASDTPLPDLPVTFDAPSQAAEPAPECRDSEESPGDALSVIEAALRGELPVSQADSAQESASVAPQSEPRKPADLQAPQVAIPQNGQQAQAAVIPTPAKQQTPGKARRLHKPRISSEAIMSVVAALMVGAAAKFIIGRAEQVGADPALEANLSRMMAQVSSESTGAASQEPISDKAERFVLKQQIGENALSFSGLWFGQRLSRTELSIVMNPSPELRPEQIGRGEKRAPWIVRLEASDWKFESALDAVPGSTPTSGNSQSRKLFKGSSLARAAIDHNGERRKLAGLASISGEYTSEGMLKLLLGISANCDEPAAHNQLSVRPRTDGSFRICGTFTLLVASEKVPAAAEPTVPANSAPSQTPQKPVGTQGP